MKIFDTLLGRTKPVKANLDALFALPGASITLESALTVVGSGSAGVCVSPGAARSFEDAWSELKTLVTPDNTSSEPKVVTDSFDYRWIVLDAPDLDSLVTNAHMVNSTLQEAGWGPQLLCSVFGFKVKDSSGGLTPGTSIYLVYLFKRGTFYPFVPTAKEKRDNEVEMRLKAILGDDIPIESDLTKWFPLWDLPVKAG
ncbi:MAG: hypothetical protein HKL80_10775 [Acidimicrobiales bacterium]|nr:hypothetical protein [Acidimicrobiales bacterium]